MTPRFFVGISLADYWASGQSFGLPEGPAHHATRVLRLADGDTITLFNGDGHPYLAVLQVAGKAASAKISQRGDLDPKAHRKIRLIQGLSVGEKMDWTIEKAVELGVHEIVVLQTNRSKVRLDADRSAKKLERWRDLIAAACAQSGRNTIPSITQVSGIAQAIAVDKSGNSSSSRTVASLIFTLEDSPQLLPQLNSLSDEVLAINVLIGPESGFSPEEIVLAVKHGAKLTSLGWRVLRTETAGPAVLAITDAWCADSYGKIARASGLATNN